MRRYCIYIYNLKLKAQKTFKTREAYYIIVLMIA